MRRRGLFLMGLTVAVAAGCTESNPSAGGGDLSSGGPVDAKVASDSGGGGHDGGDGGGGDASATPHEIKHVIVIMQENRSFDQYFGTFPGADGIPMMSTVGN